MVDPSKGHRPRTLWLSAKGSFIWLCLSSISAKGRKRQLFSEMLQSTKMSLPIFPSLLTDQVWASHQGYWNGKIWRITVICPQVEICCIKPVCIPSSKVRCMNTKTQPSELQCLCCAVDMFGK